MRREREKIARLAPKDSNLGDGGDDFFCSFFPGIPELSSPKDLVWLQEKLMVRRRDCPLTADGDMSSVLTRDFVTRGDVGMSRWTRRMKSPASRSEG